MTSAASTKRSSIIEGVQVASAMAHLPRLPLTEETLAQLVNQLALWPGEPVVILVDDEDAELVPTLALDLFGGAPRAGVAFREPSHRTTSRNTAAYPAISRNESQCAGSCASRASFRSIRQSTTWAGVTGRPSVRDHRAAIAAMESAGSP